MKTGRQAYLGGYLLGKRLGELGFRLRTQNAREDQCGRGRIMSRDHTYTVDWPIVATVEDNRR